MSHPPARTDLACRNCGSQAPLNFCPECGQETTLHPPTLGEFLHEFVGHYVALEGALWRTLGMLLMKPGRLTREYLDGRRRRYVLPLRLYLTASFLFFLVLKLTPVGGVEPAPGRSSRGRARPVVVTQASAYSGPIRSDAPRARGGAAARSRPSMHLIDCGGPHQAACNRAE